MKSTRIVLLAFVLAILTPAVTLPLQPTPQVAAAPPSQEGDGSEAGAGDEENANVTYYAVSPDETLAEIAERFGVDVGTLMALNELPDAGPVSVSEILDIPLNPEAEVEEFPVLASAPPEDVVGRMTRNARRTAANSPFYKTTWVTYYGRPNVEIMGILGEYEIEELIPRLEEIAAEYDEANGPEVGVMPAFHLIYGMAITAEGTNGNWLDFMSDEAVLEYIKAAEELGWAVILDIQIGSLTPTEALSHGFRWLEYPNVHLALDPEFALRFPDQERPGTPIGFVTATEVNEAQREMAAYMRENDIPGRRILIIHQFLHRMIRGSGDVFSGKDDLRGSYKVDLTITADGWGSPASKIGKYNNFTNDNLKYTGFKLFYRWDEPVLDPAHVLGVEQYPDVEPLEITPNLIIYQ